MFFRGLEVVAETKDMKKFPPSIMICCCMRKMGKYFSLSFEIEENYFMHENSF